MLVGENFGEFGDLLQIRQSFIPQLLVISEKAIEAELKFAKVFSHQNFLLYGICIFVPYKALPRVLYGQYSTKTLVERQI